MVIIRFNDALRLAAEAASAPQLPKEWKVRIVRDLYGRIRFAVDAPESQYPMPARDRLELAQRSLGAFATNEKVLFRDSFSNPDAVFSGPDWHLTSVSLGAEDNGHSRGNAEVLVLDRQITGQDWLRPPADDAGNAHPHRLVFFGLKGGVGRSTALMMVAWGLAREGRRVLLVDLDLESPGLSGLLLPEDRVATYGLVDWLVEDAVDQGDDLLKDMVSASPLAETTQGQIRVAAAMGREEGDYLAKLARAYVDVPGTSGPQPPGARLRRILQLLEAKEEPDVVLIDSRAGLHDLAAVAITGLADTALLFATDSEHTWAGYRQLFRHWQRRPDVATRVRERLAMVRALTPKSNRESGVKRFQEKSYELFAETLYDDIPPAMASKAASFDPDSYFHPSQTDEAAPHFPILVDWDERFQEFDPHLRPENGGATEAQIRATFGALIDWCSTRVSEAG